MPLFSIIISYRNREVIRVKRCLDALANQTFQNFEVIFVDYGTENALAESIQSLINSYPRFIYLYNDTRGMFWNQPHALNSGLKIASGTYIIRLDVDLILPPQFLLTVSTLVEINKYFHSKAYYLPEHFNHYDDLFKSGFNKINNLSISDSSVLGLLLIVHRSVILNINGFDEFYSFWGFDDLDVSSRIIKKGLNIEWLNLEEMPVYHQWHPPSSKKNPTHWGNIMYEYYKSNTEIIRNDEEIGKILTTDKRPALRHFLDGTYWGLNEFKIQYPKIYTFSGLYKTLALIKTEKGFYVKYDNPYITDKTESKMLPLVNKINYLLNKIPFSYRLTDIKIYETEFISTDEVRDALFYFLLNMHELILDYFFSYENGNVFCIIIRK